MKNIETISNVYDLTVIVRQGRYTRDFIATAMCFEDAVSFIDSTQGGDVEWMFWGETVDYLKWLPVGRGRTASEALSQLDISLGESLSLGVSPEDVVLFSSLVAECFEAVENSIVNLPHWCKDLKVVSERRDEFIKLFWDAKSKSTQ